MPVQLFIDTNVLLSFFHLSSDDLEELRKLVELIRAQDVHLHLSQQVKDGLFQESCRPILQSVGK